MLPEVIKIISLGEIEADEPPVICHFLTFSLFNHITFAFVWKRSIHSFNFVISVSEKYFGFCFRFRLRVL